jgi:uncharacterized protein
LAIAVAGTVSYSLLGWNALHLPEWRLGYVYLPVFFATGLSSIVTAPIGAKPVHKLSATKLKRYFSLLHFVMVAKLMWY